VVYNLGEPSTTVNDILQGKPKRAGRSSARFLINSTIGVLGIWDVATGMGLKAHDADFGQTFGRYGVRPGPYLYVPVIGPSNFRDGVGRVLDFFTDPVGIVGGGYTTTSAPPAWACRRSTPGRGPTLPSARWMTPPIPT
jgi:phospholipid-binding lipoprotein MlaA